jgi:integrase
MSAVAVPVLLAARPRPHAPAPSLPTLKSIRLLDQLREHVRYLHYSRRTEQAYVHWSKAFIRFHGLRHPAEMGKPEVEAFLDWLASERKVATSRLPVVLSCGEVESIFGAMSGEHRLFAQLLYGTGMRLAEGL